MSAGARRMAIAQELRAGELRAHERRADEVHRILLRQEGDASLAASRRASLATSPRTPVLANLLAPLKASSEGPTAARRLPELPPASIAEGFPPLDWQPKRNAEAGERCSGVSSGDGLLASVFIGLMAVLLLPALPAGWTVALSSGPGLPPSVAGASSLLAFGAQGALLGGLAGVAGALATGSWGRAAVRAALDGLWGAWVGGLAAIVAAACGLEASSLLSEAGAPGTLAVANSSWLVAGFAAASFAGLSGALVSLAPTRDQVSPVYPAMVGALGGVFAGALAAATASEGVAVFILAIALTLPQVRSRPGA